MLLMRTWKVIKWKPEPSEIEDWVPLDCTCGYEAMCPAAEKAPVIAAFGMALVFDPPGYSPPDNYLPNIIQCRKCKKIYTDEE